MFDEKNNQNSSTYATYWIVDQKFFLTNFCLEYQNKKYHDSQNLNNLIFIICV